MLSAAVLQQAIDLLPKLKGSHAPLRAELIHNRLMIAIDDICREHERKTGTKFSKPQLVIIKDCLFQVVCILDPHFRPKRSFLGRMVADFKEQAPLKQIGIAFTALSTLGAAAFGAYNALLPTIDRYTSGRADKLQIRPSDPVSKTTTPVPQTASPAPAASAPPNVTK